MNEESQPSSSSTSDNKPVENDDAVASNDDDSGGGRTRLWQEEDIIRRFGRDYDQPMLDDFLYLDDDNHHLLQQLPIRYLDQWYLFRRRDAPAAANPDKKYEGLWVPRSPLPEEAWMAQEDYILRGWLRPAPPDAYSYQAPPILVQINKMDLWCVNRSKTYRGYWIHTKTAIYWLRDPSTRQGNIHVRIKGNGLLEEEDDENTDIHMACAATLPRPASQEDCHWLQRARIGLVANIADLFPETEVDEEELYYPTLTPEQLHAELKNDVDDRPFDMELLRSEAAFTYAHLGGVLEKEAEVKLDDYPDQEEEDDDENLDAAKVECAFLTSLKSLTSTKVWTTAEYQLSALRAEGRTHSKNNSCANDDEFAPLLNLPLSDLQKPVHGFVVKNKNMDDDSNNENDLAGSSRRGTVNKRAAAAQGKKPLKRLKRQSKVVNDDDSDDDFFPSASERPRTSAATEAAPSVQAPSTIRLPRQTSRTTSSSQSLGTGNAPQEPPIGRVNRSTSSGSAAAAPAASSSVKPSSATKRFSLNSFLSKSGGITSLPAQRRQSSTNPSNSNPATPALTTIPRVANKLSNPAAAIDPAVAAKNQRMAEILAKKGLIDASSSLFPRTAASQPTMGQGRPMPSQGVVDLTEDDDVVDLIDVEPRPPQPNEPSVHQGRTQPSLNNFHPANGMPSSSAVVSFRSTNPMDKYGPSNPAESSTDSYKPTNPSDNYKTAAAVDNTTSVAATIRRPGWGGYPERMSSSARAAALVETERHGRGDPFTSSSRSAPFQATVASAPSSVSQGKGVPYITLLSTFNSHGDGWDDPKPAASLEYHPRHGEYSDHSRSSSHDERRSFNQGRYDDRSNYYRKSEPSGGPANVTPLEHVGERRHPGSPEYQPAIGSRSQGNGYDRRSSWESRYRPSTDDGRERRPLDFQPRASSNSRGHDEMSDRRDSDIYNRPYQGQSSAFPATQNPPAGRGRGREINKPAWMTRQEQEQQQQR